MEWISSRSTRRRVARPRWTLAVRIRITLSSRRAREIRPPVTAAVTALIAASGSDGISRTSAPACTARTEASPTEKPCAMPPISMASVTMMPLNFICSRRMPRRILPDSVAGRFGSSIAGTARCAVITESVPLAMAARKGANSTRSRRSRSPAIVARFMWVSVSVSPWPGKCLAVTSTGVFTAACAPLTKADT